MEGTKNELAARGYSRDKKRGMAQIEYGLSTDKDGRPVAIEVFRGNTADPTAFISIVETIRNRFSLDRLTMVGDRGMITSARISSPPRSGRPGWLTCLRRPQIAALAKDDGPLQLGLFDESDLAEFSHPDYPDERLIACRNPLLAEERTRKRSELFAATEEVLAPIVSAVQEGRLVGADKIGLKVGKVINKFKMAKHFEVTIGENTLSVIPATRTPSPPKPRSTGSTCCAPPSRPDLDAPGVVEPTRHSPTSNVTFGTSRSTTSTCARSITASKPGCAPTSSSACSPPTSSGTYARRWHPSPSPTRHRRARQPRRSGGALGRGSGQGGTKVNPTAKRSASSVSSSSTWAR